MTVVILTRSFDPTADWVVEELNRRRVPVFRCDAADFPLELSMSARLDEQWVGTLRTDRRLVDLGEISGIYYRRPTPFVFPEAMRSTDQEWAHVEAKIGFLGTLASVPKWLNHPSRIAHAEYKPIQLQIARHHGLRVPRTLITNVPDDAYSFARDVGEVIYKPFSPRGVMGDDGRRQLIFTKHVQADDLKGSGVGLTAHMIQEWIPHNHAVRATFVDGTIFAAEIHSHSDSARVDWRADYSSLTYEPVTVPQMIVERVTPFMSELGLRFGALDFLVTDDGGWVFLEVNPNGQWAWIGDVAPLIASAISDALEKGP